LLATQACCTRPTLSDFSDMLRDLLIH